MAATLLISDRARAPIRSPRAGRCQAPRRLPRGDDQGRLPVGHELDRRQREVGRVPGGVRRLRRRAHRRLHARRHRSPGRRYAHHPQRPQDRGDGAQRQDDVRSGRRARRRLPRLPAVPRRLRDHGQGPAQAVLVPGRLRRLLLPLRGQGAGARLSRVPRVAGPAAVTERYDPSEIEPRWQAMWEREGTWEVSNEGGPGFDYNKYYVLEMLPYPSGEPHMGHLKVYSIGDAVAHFRRRNGYRVLHPMGYDAFGLPAENHAIKTGEHPRASTDSSIAAFQQAFRRWGISIDWSREFGTHEPRYYRWTQWIFLQLLERGLAYRKEAAVKWCPKDATVLANEQVIDGRCERCGTPVEVRQLEQWFFRITDYADRLLDDLELIEWPAHVKTMQRNWIGRSAGAEVEFKCESAGTSYQVFTTRPDTLFGATFFVMAPEHPDVLRLSDSDEVREYVNSSLRETAEERGDDAREKTGVPLGRTVTNPATGEEIPMFVADYVLMEYGSGAIMAVPAHDQRDFDFAQKFDLPIRRVIEWGELPCTGDGPLVNSGRLDGKPNRAAYEEIVEWLESEGRGRRTINYKLRDWLLSRQRYWGCPIPIVHCPDDGLVPVPDDQLPVELPHIDDYTPRGRSPLAAAEDWVNTTCPTCGGPAKRETDTMDTFVDSSWHFLRYCDPRNDTAPFERDVVDMWMPVDQYIGGVEHAILHLMYARFFTKAVAGMGYLGFQEPFANLFTQGMITRDGAKMSKSRGNVVSPSEIVGRYGADTARCYINYLGPPDQDADWSDEGVGGIYRFLSRLWRIATDV